jgi:hypothetical protein
MKLQTLLCDGVIDNFLPDDNDRGSDPSVVNALHDIMDDFFGAFITPVDDPEVPNYATILKFAEENLFFGAEGEIAFDLFVHYVNSPTHRPPEITNMIENDQIIFGEDDNYVEWAQKKEETNWLSSFFRSDTKRLDINFMSRKLLKDNTNEYIYHLLYPYTVSTTPPTSTQLFIRNQHLSEITQPPIAYKMTGDDIDNINDALKIGKFNIEPSKIKDLKDGYEKPIGFYKLHKCAHEILQTEDLTIEINKTKKELEHVKMGAERMKLIRKMCIDRLIELNQAIEDAYCYKEYIINI